MFLGIKIADLLPLLVVIPICVAMLLIIIKNAKISYILTIITSLLLLLISIAIIYGLKNTTEYTYYFGGFIAPLGIEYKVTYLNALFILLITLVFFISSIYNYKLTIHEIGYNKYCFFNAVMLLKIAGYLGIVATNDAFNLFVFLEISSLATYTLISLSSTKKAYLAAFNYLIIGTIGASLYLFGLGFLYSIFGTLNITTLALDIKNANLNFALIIAISMVFTGIIIKIALFPLAFWLPSVYVNAPISATATISALSSKTSIYMFIKIIIIMLGVNASLNIDLILKITSILAILSIIIFALWANKQDDIKALLAMSSVSQIGFIMLGLSINTALSNSAALLILISHSLIKMGLFLVVGVLYWQFNTTSLNNLRGVGNKIPFTFFCIIFLSLSLISIPPSLMFFGKVHLLIAALNSQLYFYTAVVAVSSIISLIYGFKIIAHLWQPHLLPNHNHATSINIINKVPIYMYFALAILIIINIILSFNPNLIFNIITSISINNLKI